MAHIPRTICANDGTEMIIDRTGVLLEMIAAWGPYYKIYADQYKCSDCNKLVFLPADKILIEHWQEGYDQVRVDARIDFIDARKKN